jgi:hypothetical protein
VLTGGVCRKIRHGLQRKAARSGEVVGRCGLLQMAATQQGRGHGSVEQHLPCIDVVLCAFVF